MTPPQAAPNGRHHAHGTGRGPQLLRLEIADDMPPGMDIAVNLAAGVIRVRSTVSPAHRKLMLRDAMAQVRRFPRLAMLPMLATFHLRRAAYTAAEFVNGFGQHAVQVAQGAPGAVAAAAVVAIGGGVATGVATGVITPPSFTSTTKTPAPPTPIHVTLPDGPDSYLGVYSAQSPISYAGVTRFGQVTGTHPNLALYYAAVGEPLQAPFAQAAASDHAYPVIQLDPSGVHTVTAIAQGADDGSLTLLAQEVHAYGRGVVIGFGHEMNGSWFPWGYKRADPQVWVAAWQHIVNLFRAQGDYNVTWLWTISRSTHGTGPIADWWPGEKYVTWVGIDGYFYQPSDTFARVFGGAIARVRQITGDPIILAETAAGPSPAQSRQITSLFNGVKNNEILGFVWFDKSQNNGLFHQNWQLEGDPPAIAAFRRAARHYRGSRSG